MQARVRPTCELVPTESPAHLRKEFDPVAGIALIKLLRPNWETLDAHLVVHKDWRVSAAVEIFQCDLLGGPADQARTKVSTE